MNTGNGMGLFLSILLIVAIILGAGYMFKENQQQEDEKQNLTAKIEELTAKNNQLTQELEKAIAESSQNKTEIDTLNQQIASDTAKILALTEDLKKQQAISDTLKEQNQALIEEVTRLKSLTESQQSNMADLQNKYLASLNEIKNLSNKIGSQQKDPSFGTAKLTNAASSNSQNVDLLPPALLTIVSLAGLGLVVILTKPVILKKKAQPAQLRSATNDTKIKIFMDQTTYKRFKEFLKSK